MSLRSAGGCGQAGDITLVTAPFGDRVDGPDRTRYVSFDADQEGPGRYSSESTPAVRGDSRDDLASPRLINRADSRFESLENPPAILRRVRCIGALSDEALEDPERLREPFIEWETDLEDPARNSRLVSNRFRGSTVRCAHGLADSLVSLRHSRDRQYS